MSSFIIKGSRSWNRRSSPRKLMECTFSMEVFSFRFFVFACVIIHFRPRKSRRDSAQIFIIFPSFKTLFWLIYTKMTACFPHRDSLTVCLLHSDFMCLEALSKSVMPSFFRPFSSSVIARNPSIFSIPRARKRRAKQQERAGPGRLSQSSALCCAACCYWIIAANSSSLSTGIPKIWALVSLLPAFSPATT